MDHQTTDVFLEELKKRAGIIEDYLLAPRFLNRFNPEDLREATAMYTKAGGKRLRPAILLWCCGAVGGDEKIAIPAAASIEMFHTWTLVHDDILDRDDLRRGSPTVHKYFHDKALKKYSFMDDAEASHYGSSVAILAGDVQHGWSSSMLTELTTQNNVAPEITLFLINELDSNVLDKLFEGELLDVQFAYEPLNSFTVEHIEEMLWKKTGVLYRYSAMAGALIGLGKLDPDNEQVKALGEFSSRCGLAFQLQDDILGIIGNETKIGKPVGSDIREGKRTTIVHYAYKEANEEEKHIIESILGKTDALDQDVNRVISILKKYGGIEKTRARAETHIKEAFAQLEKIPDSKYRQLLASWGHFMISRSS